MSQDKIRSYRSLTGTARDMPAPNTDALAEETAPAGDGKAVARGVTDEMELPREAAKEGPAANGITEPAIRKSVAQDINENAAQGSGPANTAPARNSSLILLF